MSNVTSCKDVTGHWQLHLILDGTELDPRAGAAETTILMQNPVRQMLHDDIDESEMNGSNKGAL